MTRPLDLVIIGCGPRGWGYARLAAEQPARFRVVAAADPRTERTQRLRADTGNTCAVFASADACLAAGKLGDVAVIATQDAYHVEPCLRALELGYDVLLEKPIAPTPQQAIALRHAARRHGRRVIVCHVLRYAPLWAKVGQIVASGRLGRIVQIDHREGVGAWHQAHSFVRGHWANTATSSPMILAKSCHDMDLLRWYMGRPPLRLSSFGALSFFNHANRPTGAALRCADCRIRSTCAYDCARYASAKDRHWLHALNAELAERGSAAEISAWVEASPWGRCVWAATNDAVDHQTVSMDWGDATANFTMTAFDGGRTMTICGTTARLFASEGRTHGAAPGSGPTLVINDHHGGQEQISVDTSGAGHGGGDAGLINALDAELALPPGQQLTGIEASVDSHLMAFAAEASRAAGGTPIALDAFAQTLQERR